MSNQCGRGVAWLTHPPVTGKIEGSNPFDRAAIKTSSFCYSFLVPLARSDLKVGARGAKRSPNSAEFGREAGWRNFVSNGEQNIRDQIPSTAHKTKELALERVGDFCFTTARDLKRELDEVG